MSFIKLKNVSKIYYNNGVVANGFTKVNVTFDIGEFVAITGESGSGKSTLLNVISGLDTYEEGEMYIDGEETSYYSEEDYEDYRRKYIGNIFQNFNLINSYTVYQNVELVLLFNGKKRREVKRQVIELIKQVGLYKFRHTKVSKLSGGQKQRVAIARALAKDTPIIIADEPTGNLDQKSAKEILKLLSEIAHNKLVVIVTHNYDQVEPYVTRKIKMNDGRVLEDKKIKEIDKIDIDDNYQYKNITRFNKLRLSLRNTFNILPKLILLLFVYMFITSAVISEYASFKEKRHIESESGINYVFNNTDTKRLVVKKQDKTAFSEDDFNTIISLNNVESIFKNDVLLDNNINITDDKDIWLNGLANSVNNFKGKIDVGRMPENENEIIIEGSLDYFSYSYKVDNLMNTNFYLSDFNSDRVDKNRIIKIVGISYNNDDIYMETKLYLSDTIINLYAKQINAYQSKVKVEFLNKYHESNLYDKNYRLVSSDLVASGTAYISEDFKYECPYENCFNKHLYINVKNIYYEDNKDLLVKKLYNKYNIKNLLNIDNYEDVNGSIFINTNDYNELYDKGFFQIGVFIKDSKLLKETKSELINKGYNVLAIKDVLQNDGSVQILRIVSVVITTILLVALFFISYFVIKIILKSRHIYFSTIRMLGANKKVAKHLLILELFIVSNLAFFTFLGLLYLNHIGTLNIGFFKTILTYIDLKDYIILYIIISVMSYLISQKYAKSIFKKSAISTINEVI